MSSIQEARAKFEAETQNHSMEIIADDGGVNRCIRFSNNGSMVHSFTLTTWPGHLCISGDMGTVVFKRTDDMFEFFGNGEDISPGYWGEKIQTASDYKEFSTNYLRDCLSTWILDTLASQHNFDASDDEIESIIDEAMPRNRWRDLCVETLRYTSIDLTPHITSVDASDFDELNFEGFANQSDGAEGDYDPFDDYSARYLWLCWAVTRGIQIYKASQEGATASHLQNTKIQYLKDRGGVILPKPAVVKMPDDSLAVICEYASVNWIQPKGKANIYNIDDKAIKNAARYEHLRTRDLDQPEAGGVFAGLTPENIVLNGSDLDEAIDMEMAECRKPAQVEGKHNKRVLKEVFSRPDSGRFSAAYMHGEDLWGASFEWFGEGLFMLDATGSIDYEAVYTDFDFDQGKFFVECVETTGALEEVKS